MRNSDFPPAKTMMDPGNAKAIAEARGAPPNPRFTGLRRRDEISSLLPPLPPRPPRGSNRPDPGMETGTCAEELETVEAASKERLPMIAAFMKAAFISGVFPRLPQKLFNI